MEESKRRSYINHLVNVYKIKGRKGIDVQTVHRELRDMEHWSDDNDKPIVLREAEIAEVVHQAFYRSAWDWAEVAGARDLAKLREFIGTPIR